MGGGDKEGGMPEAACSRPPPLRCTESPSGWSGGDGHHEDRGLADRSVFIRYAIVATKDIEDAMDKLAKNNGTLIEPKEAAGD